MLALHKIHHLNLKPFFPCPGEIITFFLLITFGILEARVA